MSTVVRSGPIRFATARRFAPPEPEPPGTPTTTAGGVCPQPPSRLERVMGPMPDVPRDEDCLALSVVAPSAPGPHPVMVFLHGGGFSSGSGLLPWYDGGALAAEQDVVVVSASYRLGPFGWLFADGLGGSNLGLLDQIAALRWVRDAIGRYGGDPEQVTVFGQSAGGISIAHMLEIPDARRLFRRAILQSAPVLPTVPGQVRAASADLVAHLGDLDPHTVPAPRLLEAFGAAVGEHVRRTGDPVQPALQPVRGAGPIPAEPVAVPDDPGDLDLLVGWNADDLSAFALPADQVVAETDRLMAAPWTSRLGVLREAGVGASGYRLDWRPEGSPFGATHCVDLPLLFGDRETWRDCPMLGSTPWDEVDRLGRGLRAVWATFARTGRVDHGLAGDVPIRWDTPEGQPPSR